MKMIEKIYSKVLNKETEVIVLFSDKAEKSNLKNLWLLHGGYGDCDEWTENSDIEKLVEGKDILVIMPSAGDSFYADMADGGKYFTHLTCELPKLIEAETDIDILGSKNYIAGVSMGGYGAFKIALNYPEIFTKAAALSGSMDLKAMYDYAVVNDIPTARHFEKIFGSIENFIGSNSDLFSLAVKRKKESRIPEIFMCCGTKDFLYNLSKTYVDFLIENNKPVTYEEDEGYLHDFGYWNMKLKRILEWMGI